MGSSYLSVQATLRCPFFGKQRWGDPQAVVQTGKKSEMILHSRKRLHNNDKTFHRQKNKKRKMLMLQETSKTRDP